MEIIAQDGPVYTFATRETLPRSWVDLLLGRPAKRKFSFKLLRLGDRWFHTIHRPVADGLVYELAYLRWISRPPSAPST